MRRRGHSYVDLVRREFERSFDALRNQGDTRRRRRRRPDGGGELEPTPVEPINPKGLSGGAEAPLEFGD
jgi:hypothetical protein